MGGITLSIDNTAKRKDKDAIAITFPLVIASDNLYIKANDKSMLLRDTLKNKKQADSLMHAVNKLLNSKSKHIGIVGVMAIADSIISIYNTDGIKAAALFDYKINYTYEVAIPIKFLGLSITETSKFSYHIKLNGALTNGTKVIQTPTGHTLVYTPGQPLMEIAPGSHNLPLTYPTDFWGEYTLAK